MSTATRLERQIAAAKSARFARMPFVEYWRAGINPRAILPFSTIRPTRQAEDAPLSRHLNELSLNRLHGCFEAVAGPQLLI